MSEQQCKSCGNPLNTRQSNCQYCGSSNPNLNQILLNRSTQNIRTSKASCKSNKTMMALMYAS